MTSTVHHLRTALRAPPALDERVGIGRITVPARRDDLGLDEDVLVRALGNGPACTTDARRRENVTRLVAPSSW